MKKLFALSLMLLAPSAVFADGSDFVFFGLKEKVAKSIGSKEIYYKICAPRHLMNRDSFKSGHGNTFNAMIAYVSGDETQPIYAALQGSCDAFVVEKVNGEIPNSISSLMSEYSHVPFTKAEFE